MTLHEFETEYNELANYVLSANYTTYNLKLLDFFAFLDETSISRDLIDKLTDNLNFDEWYENCKSSVGGMVGSGSLNWAADRTERLRQQIGLFRHLGQADHGFSTFASSFLTSGNRYDDMVADINIQYFEPFANNLLRYIERNAGSVESYIPASDRIVSVDHNSAAFQDIRNSLDELEQQILQSNEIGSTEPESRERVAAEIGAGARLLQATKARISAITELLIPPLRWLASTFAKSTVGKIASLLITAIATFFGIDF